MNYVQFKLKINIDLKIQSSKRDLPWTELCVRCLKFKVPFLPFEVFFLAIRNLSSIEHDAQLIWTTTFVGVSFQSTIPVVPLL